MLILGEIEETKQAGIKAKGHANIIETKSRERKRRCAAGMAGYTLIADGAGRTRGMAVRARSGPSLPRDLGAPSVLTSQSGEVLRLAMLASPI